jgi:hypothetical protein
MASRIHERDRHDAVRVDLEGEVEVEGARDRADLKGQALDLTRPSSGIPRHACAGRQIGRGLVRDPIEKQF